MAAQSPMLWDQEIQEEATFTVDSEDTDPLLVSNSRDQELGDVTANSSPFLNGQAKRARSYSKQLSNISVYNYGGEDEYSDNVKLVFSCVLFLMVILIIVVIAFTSNPQI